MTELPLVYSTTDLSLVYFKTTDLSLVYSVTDLSLDY